MKSCERIDNFDCYAGFNQQIELNNRQMYQNQYKKTMNILSSFTLLRHCLHNQIICVNGPEFTQVNNAN